MHVICSSTGASTPCASAFALEHNSCQLQSHINIPMQRTHAYRYCNACLTVSPCQGSFVRGHPMRCQRATAAAAPPACMHAHTRVSLAVKREAEALREPLRGSGRTAEEVYVAARIRRPGVDAPRNSCTHKRLDGFRPGSRIACTCMEQNSHTTGSYTPSVDSRVYHRR